MPSLQTPREGVSGDRAMEVGWLSETSRPPIKGVAAVHGEVMAEPRVRATRLVSQVTAVSVWARIAKRRWMDVKGAGLRMEVRPLARKAEDARELGSFARSDVGSSPPARWDGRLSGRLGR